MGKKVSTDVTDFLTEEFIDNKFILSNNGNKKRLYIEQVDKKNGNSWGTIVNLWNSLF